MEIEGNTLSLEQVTAIFDKKRVLGPKKDILEVKNALEVYERLNEFNPLSLQSFCKAHKILMRGLIEAPGKIRTQSVGIAKGPQITHIAPPGARVKALLNNLFLYLKKEKELLLIKSCVFHYELEFIHPYMDGNGRMGRLWQTIILKEAHPVFEYLPIEQIIKSQQENYYTALSNSDKKGQSTEFIEFMLSVINDSLEKLLRSQNVSLDSSGRIHLSKEFFKEKSFSRQDYLRYYKEISSATASRDLKKGIEIGLLKKSGDKRTSKYKFLK